jgi:diguanylate cyclase (GGDEF)-like protein
MSFWRRLVGERNRQPLPPEIYCSLVDALFKDSRSLLVGSLAAAVTALITAWKTGELSLYFCSLAILVVSCLRALDMRAFARCREQLDTAEKMRPWERRYVVGAAAHVALMGIWCLLAFTKTNDPFVQTFSFAMTLAYMIGISGRNFASKLLVTAQIVCAAIPMTIALASVGGEYYTIFAFVLVPFFTALKFISDRLRRVLLDAVIASRDVSLLAGRFDTALNNMPHGLCMFDAERRLVVANRRLCALLHVPMDLASQRVTASELIARSRGAGTLTADDADRLSRQFEQRLTEATGGEAFVETQAGRALDLTFHPMLGGGAVVLFEDITERKLAEARINQLVRYDTLTGLPNRAAFREHIGAAVAALRRRGPFAIHFVDLDEFNQVNDTLGHPCGDELLCVAADRLRNAVRSTDVVCRFGGDEFVVLQYPLEHASEAALLAERVGDALAEPFRISGHDVVIGASIGIAIAPRDGADADALLKNADMALNRAKSDGGRIARFFEQRMDVMAQARRNLQLDVRTALACKMLEVHYQPLLNLRSKRISTCEALLRWQHPQRGMISPAEFIPVAEEMGLIVEIGKFVLNEACLQCTTWPGETRIAVNVSPMQFRRGNLIEAIREALHASGLSPGRLEIEITESVFLSDTDVARHLLDQMLEIGVRVSLDDFGTGYSSLSYLHSYPLNKVKIDRSFLSGVDRNQRQLNLLHGVARLSADLGMSVAVEGIETEEQLALVACEKSVEEVQGFLIGRAVCKSDIRTRLVAETGALGKVA